MKYIWKCRRQSGGHILPQCVKSTLVPDAVRNIIIQNRMAIYRPGDEIPCSAEGNPVPSIQWLDQTGIVVTSRTHQSGFMVSVILTVTSDMDGNCSYSCRATNTVIDRESVLYDTHSFTVAGKFDFIGIVNHRNKENVSPFAWWRHQMETFSALLALCDGNSPVTDEFLWQVPVTRSFEVFFDLCLNKRLSKQSWDWWVETPSKGKWFRASTSSTSS